MTFTQPTLVFIATYPPRECGIATFTRDLLKSCQKLLGPNLACKVAAMNISSSDTHEYPSEVVWEIDQDNHEEYQSLAEDINQNPLVTGVVLQHEYGIFGGEDGENILHFVKHCQKPLLVTLHTVLPNPSLKMKKVTKAIVKRASVIVVLTQKSKNILEDLYPEANGKVYVIPHGIHHTTFSLPYKHKKALGFDKNIILNTFGLLSRGKGIEYVIRALPKVVEEFPEVRYLVLGQTHPVVRRHEGESYRIELVNLVKELNLNKHVKFYDKYFETHDLIAYLKATDIYICTPLNPNQAVSGTLSYAVGTGRAVVSTDFVQARELITDDIGKIVPIADSDSYSKSILEILRDKKKLARSYRKAYDKTRTMLWSNIAHEYLRKFSKISPFMMSVDPLLPPISIKHFRTLTDDFALLQFGKIKKADKDFGYTVDDNARGLVVISSLVARGYKKQILPYLSKYLNFLIYAQQEDGTFINYIDAYTKEATEQNYQENLRDANARALWSLSEVVKNNYLSQRIRHKALNALKKGYHHNFSITEIKASAYMIKMAQNLLETDYFDQAELKELVKFHADLIVDAFNKNSSNSWVWYENILTYNNGVLPESLFKAWQVTHKSEYIKIAKKTINFLVKKSFIGDICVPVGQAGWYKKGYKKSEFDQQPEEPAALVQALLTAYEVTQNGGFRHLAEKAFLWFLGNNILGVRVYDYSTGGCHDALTKTGLNLNQGAESLVSYLLARLSLEEASKSWIS